MALDSTEKEIFGILNFGHWDLFEIWILVLGILSMTQKDNELHTTNNFLNFARNRCHEVTGQIPIWPHVLSQAICGCPV